MKPTREQVLAEPAGRQMDAWVAEWVMKLSYILFDGYDRDAEELTPCYSDDIEAAWMVVEKFTDVTIEKSGLNYTATIDAHAQATSPTAPLAICRAALLAVLEDA